MENKLIANLKNIAIEDYRLFDKNLVTYLIENIEPKEVENIDFNLRLLKKGISTDLWGLIKAYQIEEFKDNEIYKEWEQILKNNPNTSYIAQKTPRYYYSLEGKDIEVTYEAIKVLKNIKDWEELEKNGMNLSHQDELTILKDFLGKDQNYTLYTYKDNTQEKFIIQKLKNNIDILKKQKYNLVDKMFISENFMRSLKELEAEDLNGLFEKEDLIKIYKKSTLKANVETNPHIVSALLPLYDKEVWYKIMCKEKPNFIEIFNPLVGKALGREIEGVAYDYVSEINKTKIYQMNAKPRKRPSYNILMEIKKRFEYFSENMADFELSQKDKLIWYVTLNRLNDEELYLKSREVIDLPENYIVNKLDIKEHLTKDLNKWEIQYNYNKLNNELIKEEKTASMRAKI